MQVPLTQAARELASETGLAAAARARRLQPRFAPKAAEGNGGSAISGRGSGVGDGSRAGWPAPQPRGLDQYAGTATR